MLPDACASFAVAEGSHWHSPIPARAALQFDYTVKTANGYYSGASSNVSTVHKDNMQRFHSSRDAYFSKVQEAVEYVKAHGITGSARSAADSLLAQVEGARNIPAAVEKQASFATEKVKEAWTNFQGLPIGACLSSSC